MFIDDSHVQLVIESAELAGLLEQLSLQKAAPVQVTYGVSRLHDVYLTLLKEGA
jgi:hypothetical protein